MDGNVVDVSSPTPSENVEGHNELKMVATEVQPGVNTSTRHLHRFAVRIATLKTATLHSAWRQTSEQQELFDQVGVAHVAQTQR